MELRQPNNQPLIDLAILQETLKKVTETPERADAFVKDIYNRLFDPIKNGTRQRMSREDSDRITAEIQRLFVHTDWVYMRRTMLATLSAVVNGMRAGDPNIMPSVAVLGRRHEEKHGVRPEYYPVVKYCLLAAFGGEHGLPRTYWTPEVQEVWSQAIDLIAQAMTTPQAAQPRA